MLERVFIVMFFIASTARVRKMSLSNSHKNAYYENVNTNNRYGNEKARSQTMDSSSLCGEHVSKWGVWDVWWDVATELTEEEDEHDLKIHDTT